MTPSLARLDRLFSSSSTIGRFDTLLLSTDFRQKGGPRLPIALAKRRAKHRLSSKLTFEPLVFDCSTLN